MVWVPFNIFDLNDSNSMNMWPKDPKEEPLDSKTRTLKLRRKARTQQNWTTVSDGGQGRPGRSHRLRRWYGTVSDGARVKGFLASRDRKTENQEGGTVSDGLEERLRRWAPSQTVSRTVPDGGLPAATQPRDLEPNPNQTQPNHQQTHESTLYKLGNDHITSYEHNPLLNIKINNNKGTKIGQIKAKQTRNSKWRNL